MVVLTRARRRRPGRAARWFLLAAVSALAARRAVVAVASAAGSTRPLREADDAARRIAAGDLAARLRRPPAGADDELADLARVDQRDGRASSSARAALEQQFLLSVSHDLRTPLTSIRGYAEAIADGTAPDAGRARRA